MSEKFSGKTEILKSSGGTTITLDGNTGNITAGGNGSDGDIIVRNKTGDSTVFVDGDKGDIKVYREIGGSQTEVMKFSGGVLDVGTPLSSKKSKDLEAKKKKDKEIEGAQWGLIRVRDSLGKVASYINRVYIAIGRTDYPGSLKVRGDKGDIHLDGKTASITVPGDIKLSGADCAEEFDVADLDEIDSGTVLIIDDEGKLRPCEQPYDKKVAGVVSGGNGYSPGIILDRNPTSNKRLPIALNGKVYCRVDAQYSPIEIGDLLTTSPTTGHAMKADEPSKAFGAVIGKALRPLREGQESIPILVALQ
jgi:hypothetical protein